MLVGSCHIYSGLVCNYGLELSRTLNDKNNYSLPRKFDDGHGDVFPAQ
jgi:hypothetical protein